MGRSAAGPRVYWKRGWAYAYFTWEGEEYRPALGTRDGREAQKAAAREYAKVVGGWRKPVRAARGGHDLADLLDRWIGWKQPTIHPRFVSTLQTYAKQYVQFFGKLDRITEATIGDFNHRRLGEALRKTVLRERAYLVQFLDWCRVHEVISQMPVAPRLPPKAMGTRTGKQRAQFVHITPTEAALILAKLPELSKKIGPRKWPLRALYALQWETALRPETLARLSVPLNWRPEAKFIELTDPDDKARWGRVVDITPRAVAILKKVAPEAGPIFGRHCYYKAIKAAAVAVLGEERGRRFAPYDFRHGRAKDWLDAGAKMRGVSYQLGHRRPSTTDKYLAPDRQAGAEAIKAGRKKK